MTSVDSVIILSDQVPPSKQDGVDGVIHGKGTGDASSRTVALAVSTLSDAAITITPHSTRRDLVPIYDRSFVKTPSQAAAALSTDHVSRRPLRKTPVNPFENWKKIYGEELVNRFVIDQESTYKFEELHALFNKIYFCKQWEAKYGAEIVALFIPSQGADITGIPWDIPWISQQLREYETERVKALALLGNLGIHEGAAEKFLQSIPKSPQAFIEAVDALLEKTYGKDKTHSSKERVHIAAHLAPLSERVALYIEMHKQMEQASEFLRFIEEELTKQSEDLKFAINQDDLKFMVEQVFPHYLSGEMAITPEIKTEILNCLRWMSNSRSLSESWEKIFGFNQFDAGHRLIYNIDAFRDHLLRELDFKAYLLTIQERTSWEQLKLRAGREADILGHLSLAQPEQLDLLQSDRNKPVIPVTAALIPKMRKKADHRKMDPSQLFQSSREKRLAFIKESNLKIEELRKKTEVNNCFDEPLLELHQDQARDFIELSDPKKIESLECQIQVKNRDLSECRDLLSFRMTELTALKNKFLGQFVTDEGFLYELSLRPEEDILQKVQNQRAEILAELQRSKDSAAKITLLQKQLKFLQWVEEQPGERDLKSQITMIAATVRNRGKLQDQIDLLEAQVSSLESQLKLLSPGMNGIEPQSKLKDIFVLPIGDVLYRSNDDKGKGGKYTEGKWAVADLRRLPQEKKKAVLKQLEIPLIGQPLNAAKPGERIYFDLDAEGNLVKLEHKGPIALFYVLPSDAVQAYQSRELGLQVRVKKVDGCYRYTQPEEDSLFSRSKSGEEEDVLTAAIDSQVAIILTRKIMARFVGPHPLSFKAYQNAIGHFYAVDQSDLAQVYYKKSPAFVEVSHLNKVTSERFAPLINQIARVQKIEDELGTPYNPDAELIRLKDMALAIKLYGDWAKEIDHFTGADVPKLIRDCEKEFHDVEPILEIDNSKDMNKACALYKVWRVKMDAFIASKESYTLQDYSKKFKSIKIDVSILEKLITLKEMPKLIEAYKKWEKQIDQFLATEKMAASLNMFATKFREIRPAFHLDKTESALEELFRDIAKPTMNLRDIAKTYTPEEQSFLISRGLNYVEQILGNTKFMAGLFFLAFCYNSQSLQLLTTKIMNDHKFTASEQQEFNNMLRKVIQFHIWTSDLLKKLMDGATELSPEFIAILNNNIKIQDDLRFQEILQTRMKQMLLSQPPEDLRSAMRFFRQSKRAEQGQSAPVRTSNPVIAPKADGPAPVQTLTRVG